MTPIEAGDVGRRHPSGQSRRHSPEPTARPAAGRFHVLDGWRGICALLVAVHHLRFYGHFYELPAIRNAYLFVDFFFVLSGFVISHAYLNRLGSLNDISVFVVRRLGRLWPLHMFVLLAFVAIQVCLSLMLQATDIDIEIVPFQDDYSLHIIPSHVLLIHSLGLYDTDTWNDPSWSISVEFYLYVAFAFLCLALPRHRSSVFLGLTFLSAATITAYAGDIEVSSDLGFFRGLYGFLIGYAVYQIWKRGSSGLRWPSIWEPGAVAATFAFTSLCGDTSASLMAPLVFGIAVWVFAHEAGTISSLLRRRAFIFLGAISYSIYMVHAFIADMMYYGIRAVAEIVDLEIRSVGGESELVYYGAQSYMDALMLVYALAVLLTASFAYRYIEQPGRRYFNRLVPTIATSNRRASRSISDTTAG